METKIFQNIPQFNSLCQKPYSSRIFWKIPLGSGILLFIEIIVILQTIEIQLNNFKFIEKQVMWGINKATLLFFHGSYSDQIGSSFLPRGPELGYEMVLGPGLTCRIFQEYSWNIPKNYFINQLLLMSRIFNGIFFCMQLFVMFLFHF